MWFKGFGPDCQFGRRRSVNREENVLVLLLLHQVSNKYRSRFFRARARSQSAETTFSVSLSVITRLGMAGIESRTGSGISAPGSGY
jgi:hypothetical protein